MTNGKKPKGIYIFAFLLIGSSLIHMLTLLASKNWYFTLYSYMDEALIQFRYSFSWFQRVIGLSIGIGLLFHKNLFRRLVILLSWFSIATIYWKHPIRAFKTHAAILDSSALHQRLMSVPEAMGTPGFTMPSFSDLAVVSSMFHAILDIAFFAVIIYYFTRPEIIEVFKEEG